MRLCTLLALGLIVCGCRKGTQNQSASFVPISAVAAGTQGCGALPAPPTGLTELTLSGATQAAIGPQSRLAAVPGTSTAYLTGADGSVHLLDLATMPVGDTLVVSPGTIETLLGLAPSSAQLSGLAIVDLATLVVAEHTSNTLVDVLRTAVDDVALFAGVPSPGGGFQDGQGGSIFFRFEAPVDLLGASPRTVYVTDTGNHAIRRVDRVSRAGIASAVTIAGTGAPGFADGDLAQTAFDTPSGLTLTCPGEMIVTESGAQGMGGNRLRLLRVGSSSFFGGFDGVSMTLAGDGSPVSIAGQGELAALAAPVAPVLGADAGNSLVFWIDSGTGALRRYDFTTALADCPLDPGCGSSFPAGTGFALVRGGDDRLYVLQADSARLFRVDP